MFDIWNKDKETHLTKTEVGDIHLQCNFPSGTNHIKIKKILKNGKNRVDSEYNEPENS